MLRVLRPHASETPTRSRAERWQRVGAVAALGLAPLFLLARCAAAPDVAFLCGDSWITNPREVDARVQQYGATQVPVATFVRRFDLASVPADARLHVEAARAHRVRINGAPAWASADSDPGWRGGRDGEVTGALRAGANEIAIDVWNRRGPPLLRARLDAKGPVLTTDETWTVSVDGGPPASSVAPDDTRLHPSHAAGFPAARAFREQGALVIGVLLISGVALGLGSGWLSKRRAALPALALALVHVLWLALFAAKLVDLPVTTGFDARHHLDYVDWLRRERSLPLPSDGWSTYHPPLYYALVAAAQQLAGGAGAVATKLPSFAAGLGLVWATWALARSLLAARPELVAAAVLFAGVLPLDVYSAAYVSNEPLHAALFGLAVWITARALAVSKLHVLDAALAGAAVGLALLAKLTALVLALVAAGFLLARVVQREGLRLGRLFAVAGAYAGALGAVCGWFYARNVIHYGTPVVGNWNLPGQDWWSQPGFHTAAYYAGFGEVLRRPVLSGFHSFADAMYASFWGDGWIAGRASAAFATESWSWALAAIGYWLALPATLALLLGLACMGRLALARAESGRRVAWSFLLAVVGALGTALVALTLDLPYFGQAKSPYLLGLIPILAIAFALGADAVERALVSLGGPSLALLGRAWWLGSAAVLWLSMAA